MATISFKSDDILKAKLATIAHKKGINTSAYIKLILTKEINKEMTKLTENGLTLAEELNIIASAKNDQTQGPFKNADDLIKSLET